MKLVTQDGPSDRSFPGALRCGFLHPATDGGPTGPSKPPGSFFARGAQPGIWTRVRQVAAIAALAYLAAGVAIPWLLLEAPPSSPYAIAGAPDYCDAPAVADESCRAGRFSH